jgi:hypothetical protein
VKAKTAVMTLVITPLILLAGLVALVGLALLGATRRVRRPGVAEDGLATLAPVTRLDSRPADVALRHAA